MVINPDINLQELNNEYLIYNMITKVYYRIGKEEYLFLKSYQTEEDLELNWDAGQLDAAEKLFLKNQILLNDEHEQIEYKKPKLKRNIVKFRLLEFEIDNGLDKISKVYQFLTSKAFEMVLKGICIFGFIYIGIFIWQLQTNEVFYQELTHTMHEISLPNLMLVYVLVLLSVIIHELAHILTCKKYCGTAGSVGLMLYFLQPTIYTDLTHLNTVSDKKIKNKVLSAGIFVQLVISAVCVMTLMNQYFFDQSMSTVLGMVGILNFAIAVYNLIPFIKLDGYWIMSNHLHINHLYEKSLTFVYCQIFKLKEKEKLHDAEINKGLLWKYGMSAMVFFIILWVSILTSVYTIVATLGDNMSAQFVVVILAALIFREIIQQVKGINIKLAK